MRYKLAEDIPLQPTTEDTNTKLENSDVDSIIEDVGTTPPATGETPQAKDNENAAPMTPTEDPLNIRAKDIIKTEVFNFLLTNEKASEDEFLNHLYKNGWTQERLIELYGINFLDSLKEELKMADKQKKAELVFDQNGGLVIKTEAVTAKEAAPEVVGRGRSIIALRRFNKVAQDLILRSSGVRKLAEEELTDLAQKQDEKAEGGAEGLDKETAKPAELSEDVKESLTTIEKELGKAVDKLDELIGGAEKDVESIENEMESKEDLSEVKDLEELVDESKEEIGGSKEMTAALSKEIKKVEAVKNPKVPVVEAKKEDDAKKKVKDEVAKEEKKDKEATVTSTETKPMEPNARQALINKVKRALMVKRIRDKIAAKKEAFAGMEKKDAPFAHQTPKDWGMTDVGGTTAKAKERGINGQDVSWSKPQGGSVDRRYFKVNASIDQVMAVTNFVNNKLAKAIKAYRIAAEKTLKDVSNPITQSLLQNLKAAGAPDEEAQRIAMEVIVAGEDFYRTIEKEAETLFDKSDIEVVKESKVVRESNVNFDVVVTKKADKQDLTPELPKESVPLQTTDVDVVKGDEAQVKAYWNSKRSVKK